MRSAAILKNFVEKPNFLLIIWRAVLFWAAYIVDITERHQYAIQTISTFIVVSYLFNVFWGDNVAQELSTPRTSIIDSMVALNLVGNQYAGLISSIVGVAIRFSTGFSQWESVVSTIPPRPLFVLVKTLMSYTLRDTILLAKLLCRYKDNLCGIVVIFLFKRN